MPDRPKAFGRQQFECHGRGALRATREQLANAGVFHNLIKNVDRHRIRTSGGRGGLNERGDAQRLGSVDTWVGAKGAVGIANAHACVGKTKSLDHRIGGVVAGSDKFGTPLDETATLKPVRPDPAANAIAGLEDDNLDATLGETICRGQSRDACTDHAARFHTADPSSG